MTALPAAPDAVPSRPLILAAPIQGLTELPWRHWHREMFPGAVDSYFTPFLRVERGGIRRRDLRDLSSDLNRRYPAVAQVIFRDAAEFEMLVDGILATGTHCIDLNLGCPFPPQVHHGRGSGALVNPAMLATLAPLMEGKYSDVIFSAKVRLGVDRPDQWLDSIDTLNRLPLAYVTVHARTAVQQYGGEVDLEQFGRFLERSAHPVIYNGDLDTPARIDSLLETNPVVAGVMLGRGLISRPSLAREWRDGCEYRPQERLALFMQLHAHLYSHYLDTLSGDQQILGKMKPYWENLDGLVDRKVIKGVRKANTLRKYNDALAGLR